MSSKVAVVRTGADSVLDDVARVMSLAGLSDVLDPDSVIVLKDNISWHLPFISANTTPWQLEGAILALRSSGYDRVVAVHNDTVVTDAYVGGRLTKLKGVYERYGIEERYNFEPADMEWVEYSPKTEMLALDRVYPDGIRIPDFMIGKNVIHLPTMKCHVYTTTTGAMKNAFGGLLGRDRHYAHSLIHETLVDLLAIQKDIHPGVFALMDGTVAGDGPGPRTMRPVEKNVILAGADQVAIDAVAASMMGFDPMEIAYIRLAHERGLGVGKVDDIEIVGDEDAARERWGFSVGSNLVSSVGSAFWKGRMRGFQQLLFHTPLVHLFSGASSVYHDHLWWPLVGRERQGSLQSGSQWGRLMERY